MKNIGLNDFDAVLFDLDGTIYYGNDIIDGAKETIEFLKNNGKKVFFITNNSSATRTDILCKLKGMGIECSINDIFNSGYLAVIVAKKMQLNNFFILGSEGLKNEFISNGITVSDSNSCDNLLIGFSKNYTYKDLTNGLEAALRAKYIISCNKERSFSGESKKTMPGGGAMVAAIEWCSNRECDFIVGKPNPLMINEIVHLSGLSRRRILVVGDVYESDIALANNSKTKSILITSDIKTKWNVQTIKSIKELPYYLRESRL